MTGERFKHFGPDVTLSLSGEGYGFDVDATACNLDSDNQLRHLNIHPDVIADFTAMPFPDESFWLVVFDPPHLKHIGENAWMAKKYGCLEGDWKSMLRDGFRECMRVLKPGGTLIFKWSEVQILVGTIWDAIGERPIFGTRCGKSAKTIWATFWKPVEKGGDHA